MLSQVSSYSQAITGTCPLIKGAEGPNTDVYTRRVPKWRRGCGSLPPRLRPWPRPGRRGPAPSCPAPRMPGLLCFSVFPAAAACTEDGGRGGKVAPVFGEWLPFGNRHGDTVVAQRTCFPDRTPLRYGLGHFRPRRVSAIKGPRGLLHGRFLAPAQNRPPGPHITVPSANPSLVLALNAGYLFLVPVL